MRFVKNSRFMLIPIILIFFQGILFSEDIFRLFAAPGSIALNLTYEWDSAEPLEVQVEHEGVAIDNWFMVLDSGQASDFTIRKAGQASSFAEYQAYKEASHSNVIKDTSVTFSSDNVITSLDFGSPAAANEVVTFNFYFTASSGQFVPSGVYTDTLLLTLYKGIPGTPPYTFVESTSIAVTIRMAKLMDVYMEREPGIRSLDFRTAGTSVLLATAYERSNANLGYTVSVTSGNFADDQTGHSEPYFLHETDSDFIEYTLSYGGAPVGGWSAGSAEVTVSNDITNSGTTWLENELRINYSAATDQISGYYQDILTVTLTAN